ncbi:hypothetical protein AXG93_1333s1210 [Marchantia polymorpha subsp. ruderalis]|uniref:Uncharacterized protein n=1 Tax=Marchantia polymorpha subsp. ruderalis TaxID=1480154 RepID=A0A176WPD1_MARPO|nr:hypothetical protein AXG93_1333s1210 [Marchantia polymorpha subsp. ruderalis]
MENRKSCCHWGGIICNKAVLCCAVRLKGRVGVGWLGPGRVRYVHGAAAGPAAEALVYLANCGGSEEGRKEGVSIFQADDDDDNLLMACPMPREAAVQAISRHHHYHTTPAAAAAAATRKRWGGRILQVSLTSRIETPAVPISDSRQKK